MKKLNLKKIKLKLCPFCGGEAEAKKDRDSFTDSKRTVYNCWVGCFKCKIYKWSGKLKNGVKSWNRRIK